MAGRSKFLVNEVVDCWHGPSQLVKPQQSFAAPTDAASLTCDPGSSTTHLEAVERGRILRGGSPDDKGNLIQMQQAAATPSASTSIRASAINTPRSASASTAAGLPRSRQVVPVAARAGARHQSYQCRCLQELSR